MIDLRSDTVTKPTEEMRKAMTLAEVGDDVYGEDPSINALQELAAEMLGKEAGIFVPSGTMGNLVSVLANCERGDEVIMGTKGHTFLFEGGGISALGGVFPHTLTNQPDGTINLQEIEHAIRSNDDHHPRSRMVILENTHNRCGGVPISEKYTNEVSTLAHNKGLLLHIDGARVFNAAIALNTSAENLTRNADSVTFCLSKGLCAPVGSVVCGSKDFIKRCKKIRKQLGGGMRQAGIIAAAGTVALVSMVNRLADDHQRARELSSKLALVKGLRIDMGTPYTNMIFLSMEETVRISPLELLDRLKDEGILIGKVDNRQFRLVTHYWISDEDISKVVCAFQEIIK